jgi:hypothetical protein
MTTTPTTILKKVTDEIQTGEFKLEKDIGLTHISTIKITTVRDFLKKYGKKAYTIKVSAAHPYFGDISFAFNYIPINGECSSFTNKSGEGICHGTKPTGDMKDIVIAALSHESYAYQISNNRTTWIHAENNPEDGNYLLWHLNYYGKYSPRSKWRLPTKCETEKLWTKHKCNICEGTRCRYVQTVCARCGDVTKKLCPVCKSPTCQKHSHCVNEHLNLTLAGMFEGMCARCGRKSPLGEKPCSNCGRSDFKHF